jgi:hypothetical protein
MKRTQLIGACLFVVLACSAVPNAWATSPPEPEFLTKVVVPAASKIPVTGIVGVNYVAGMSGSKVECKSGALVGEVTGPQSLAGIKVTLKKCGVAGSAGSKCTTAGQAPETILSATLAGDLNNVAAAVPGLKLYNQAAKGSPVTEFDCAVPGFGTFHDILKGSWIGELTTAVGSNEKTGKIENALTTWFRDGPVGTQQFEEFTGGSEQFLNSHLENTPPFGFEAAAQNAKVTLKTVPATWGLGVTK